MSDESQRPTLEVAIVGAGVTPDEVPVRELLEMLGAAVALLDALAKDSSKPSAHVALTAVRPGSAAYLLRATQPDHDAEFGRHASRFYSTIENRGRGASPDVRRHLVRLHRSGANLGAVRVRYSARDEEREPLITSAPLEVVPAEIGASTVMHATVVGVEAKRGGCVVTIKPDDGSGKVDLEAEPLLAERAARLFNRTVRVIVGYSWDLHDARGDWVLRDIVPWSREPFLELIEELRAEGVTFDRRALLAELEEES
ncbi:MAG: hypothetical protein OHK0013_47030 [Sandaracinaceae bacterium]